MSASTESFSDNSARRAAAADLRWGLKSMSYATPGSSSFGTAMPERVHEIASPLPTPRQSDGNRVSPPRCSSTI